MSDASFPSQLPLREKTEGGAFVVPERGKYGARRVSEILMLAEAAPQGVAKPGDGSEISGDIARLRGFSESGTDASVALSGVPGAVLAVRERIGSVTEGNLDLHFEFPAGRDPARTMAGLRDFPGLRGAAACLQGKVIIGYVSPADGREAQLAAWGVSLAARAALEA